MSARGLNVGFCAVRPRPLSEPDVGPWRQSSPLFSEFVPLKMSTSRKLRALVSRRLADAAEEIFELFERTIAEYEAERRELLAGVHHQQLSGARADVQPLLVVEAGLPEQQKWISSLDQEDLELPHIKEEQAEFWTFEDGEQLQSLEEAGVNFPFSLAAVKTEDDVEGKSQTSQFPELHNELFPEESGTDSTEVSSIDSEEECRPTKAPSSSSDEEGTDTHLKDADQPKCTVGKHNNPETCWKTKAKKRKTEATKFCVTIKSCTKREDRKRAWDKKQYCLYCGQSNLKMARHLQRKHMEMKDVAYAFSFPTGSKDRKILLEQLRNRGNFKHNAKVLEEGNGELVTWKQPSDEASVQDYLPCPYCYGMFAKKDLWRHKSSCKSKKHV